MNSRFVNELEQKYNIQFPKELLELSEMDGCYNFSVNNEQYEIRHFLTFKEDKYFSVKLSLQSFIEEYNGKFIPFAVDSGDSYYCYNTKNKSIYYGFQDEDSKNIKLKLSELKQLLNEQ